MSNIDLSQIITAADKAAETHAIHEATVKQACTSRIREVFSINAQINLIAAQAARTLSADDSARHKAGLAWIEAMRKTCAALAADPAADWQDDTAWPYLPKGVAALAEQV